MRTQRRVKRRFFVEELETRLVPAAVTSANWAGYAVTTSPGAVSAVSGNWTVPAVSGRGTSFSSAWVGIDGVTSPTVEQVGTEQDLFDGVPQYAAWYEMYPSYPVYLAQTVQAGDSISGSVTASASGAFVLEIKDGTAGWSFSTTQSLPSAQRSSAEWVVEAPASSSGILPLANFGSVTFTQAAVTLGTASAAAVNNSAGQATAINLVSSSGAQATTSALTDSGNSATSSFTVAFAAANPASANPGTAPGAAPAPHPHRHHRGQTNIPVSQSDTTPAATTASGATGTAGATPQALTAAALSAFPPAVMPPSSVVSPTLPPSSSVVSPALTPPSGLGAVSPRGLSLAASYPDGGGTDQLPPADLPPADVQPAAHDAGTTDGRAQPESGPGAKPTPAPKHKPDAPKAPAPMPAPAPDALPADRQVAGVTWRRACDAYFVQSQGSPATAQADTAIGRLGDEETAAVPAAGMALALTLGASWRVTSEETEIRRRRWKVR